MVSVYFLRNLIKLANELDQSGLIEEANELDCMLLKLAMTWTEACSALGVSSNATKEEVNSAFKQMALKHHPDKGGDAEKMKELNVARDKLLGEPVEETENIKDIFKTPDWLRKYTEEQFDAEYDRKNEEIDIRDFNTEASSLSLGGVSWLFTTGERTLNEPSGRFPNYAQMYVVVGKTAEHYVFVGVLRHKKIMQDIRYGFDEYTMNQLTLPIDCNFAKNAPVVIKKMYDFFADMVEGFFEKSITWNGLIRLLPQDSKFDREINGKGGPSCQFSNVFKDIDKKDVSNVGFEMVNHRINGKTTYTMFVTLDGIRHKLSEGSVNAISESYSFLRSMFGDNYYMTGYTLKYTFRNKDMLNELLKNIGEYESKGLVSAIYDYAKSLPNSPKENQNIDMAVNSNGLQGTSVTDNQGSGMFSGLSDSYMYSSYQQQEGVFDHGGYNREELDRKLTI